MPKKIKRKRIPKHIQDEIDAIPLSEDEERIGELAIRKAIALGLVALSFGDLVPTEKGKYLLSLVEKPQPWFGSNEEEVALLLIAANDFKNPLG